MSHFVTFVLLDNQPACFSEAEKMAEELLAQYSESLEVEEYDRKCYCIGDVARKEAREAALKACGVESFDEIREDFHKNVFPAAQAKFLSDNEVSSLDELSDEKCADLREAAWEKHIEKFKKVEKEVFDAHPMKDKPDPGCGLDKDGKRYDDGSGCGGTGIYRSTYNQISKWDWWCIGGRWNGYLSDYDPESDPNNFEQCPVCGGTGERTDMEVDNGCNGCSGKGERLKWHSAFPKQSSNIMPVSGLSLDNPEVWAKQCPFAIVTPDGKWNEKGEMGWWGITTNEKGNWKDEAKEILKAHEDKWLVVCDLHI